MNWIKLSTQEPELGQRCFVLIDGEKEGPVTWTVDRGFVYEDGHELGRDCSCWRKIQTEKITVATKEIKSDLFLHWEKAVRVLLDALIEEGEKRTHGFPPSAAYPDACAVFNKAVDGIIAERKSMILEKDQSVHVAFMDKGPEYTWYTGPGVYVEQDPDDYGTGEIHHKIRLPNDDVCSFPQSAVIVGDKL